jgi:integrase, catalytic region
VKKAITPSPQCAGGPGYQNQDTTPGLTDPSHRLAIGRKDLAIMIKDIFEDSDGTHGYRRNQVMLERHGVRADRSIIRAIMKNLRLPAAQPRAKVRTTVPADDLDERADLLKRNFTADKPGKKLCGDITHVRTWAGFIYLATLLDC